MCTCVRPRSYESIICFLALRLFPSFQVGNFVSGSPQTSKKKKKKKGERRHASTQGTNLSTLNYNIFVQLKTISNF